MPGRETMSVSKAKKSQIRSAPRCGAAKGSLIGLGSEAADLAPWDSCLALGNSGKPYSAGPVSMMLHLLPLYIQRQVFFRGRLFDFYF